MEYSSIQIYNMFNSRDDGALADTLEQFRSTTLVLVYHHHVCLKIFSLVSFFFQYLGYIGWVTVTTRIITCLGSGIPIILPLSLASWEGIPHPIYRRTTWRGPL